MTPDEMLVSHTSPQEACTDLSLANKLLSCNQFYESPFLQKNLLGNFFILKYRTNFNPKTPDKN
jgi:hypothetical protein